MEFEDKEIIAIRTEEKKRAYLNLETGIYAGDQLIKFTELEIFEKKFKLYLPTNFYKMPIEEAKQKYISENRPQLILTEATGTVNLTFNFLEDQVSPELLEGVLLQYRMLFQRVQPSYEFIDSGEIAAKNMQVHWFDFRSPGLDFSIYNLLWIASVEGHLLLGMFNAPLGLGKIWKYISMQLLATLTDLTIGSETI